MGEPPPNSVIQTMFLDDVETAEMGLMCRGIRVIIRVCGPDLAEHDENGSSALRTQFLKYLKDKDEKPEMVDEFQEWATIPIVPFLQEHAPAKMPELFTLLAYYAPQTFFFTLVSRGGTLHAQQFQGSPRDTRPYEPRVDASDLTKSGSFILHTPRIQASAVRIIPDVYPSFYEFCPIPHSVMLSDSSDRRLFFKAVSFREEFDRVLDVYARCSQVGISCMPRLVALVEWPEDGKLMGLLTECVNHVGTLIYEGRLASASVRQTWADQIQATANELHSIGCLWVDVMPDNVLIDTRGNARVVDFGRGYLDHSVDPELADSHSGDWHGPKRIREYLEI